MFGIGLFLLDFFFPRIEEKKGILEDSSVKPGKDLFIRYGNDGVFNSGSIRKKVSYPGDQDEFTALISIGHDPRNKFIIVNYGSISEARADVLKILVSSSFKEIDQKHLIREVNYAPKPTRINRNSSHRGASVDRKTGGY